MATTTHCRDTIAELRALRIEMEEDVAWLEHDRAEPERQYRLRSLIAVMRRCEEQAELTAWLVSLPATLRNIAPYRDYAAAGVMKQEWPGIRVEVFGG